MPTPTKIVDGIVIPLTQEEILEFESQQEAYSELLAEREAQRVRQERDFLLSETDWTALSDRTMTPEMATYRQALRDITKQEGFPYQVDWPVKP